MSKRGKGHFSAFDEHTRLKHQILNAYLDSWARKLLRGGRHGGRVWFVDGFAGEGEDKRGNPGSPLIAARVAANVLDEQGPISRGAPMIVLAIEKDQRRFDRLQDVLQPFVDFEPTLARAAEGTLGDYLDDITESAGNDPVLFFLDPFGVKGLVVDQFPTVLDGPQNEVFVLFSHMGARRLHATLLSEERDVEYEIERIRERPSLFPEYDEEVIEEIRREGERSIKSLRATQRSAEEILGEALGPAAIEVAEAASPNDRPAVLTKIFMGRLREAGAQYVVALPIRNAKNAPVYQLVYATKSPVGLRTMKQAMHTGLNTSDLPHEVKAAIREELARDLEQVVDGLRSYFAGREVPWTEGRDRAAETVKKYLLEQTLVFPWQFRMVRRTLKSAGLRLTGRKNRYRFPTERP